MTECTRNTCTPHMFTSYRGNIHLVLEELESQKQHDQEGEKLTTKIIKLKKERARIPGFSDKESGIVSTRWERDLFSAQCPKRLRYGDVATCQPHRCTTSQLSGLTLSPMSLAWQDISIPPKGSSLLGEQEKTQSIEKNFLKISVGKLHMIYLTRRTNALILSSIASWRTPSTQPCPPCSGQLHLIKESRELMVNLSLVSVR